MANTLDSLAMNLLEHLQYLGVEAKHIELVLARACRIHREAQLLAAPEGPPPLSPTEFKAASKNLTPIEEESDDETAPVDQEKAGRMVPRNENGGGARPRFPDLEDRIRAILIVRPKATMREVYNKLEETYGSQFMGLPHFKGKYWLPILESLRVGG